MRLDKTIASVVLAASAAIAGVYWLSCAPRRSLDDIARLADGMPPGTSPSAISEPTAMHAAPAPELGGEPSIGAASGALSEPPVVGPTVAEILETSACSTEVVRGLSEQIIAEESCLRPSAFLRLPERFGKVTVGDVVFPFLAAPANDALVSAVASAKREPMTVNSMLRTIVQQYLLFDWYKRGRCHIKLAAPPGRSNHQSGLSIDIQQPQRWRSKLSRFGFRWMGKRDRWHFDFIGRDPKERAEVKRIAEEHAGLDVRAFQRLWNRNHADEQLGESGEFDHKTESALRRAPVSGFGGGTTCSK